MSVQVAADLIGGPLDGKPIVVELPPCSLLEFPQQNDPVQLGERGDVVGGDTTYWNARYELDRTSADAFVAQQRALQRGIQPASPVRLVYRYRYPRLT